MTDAPRPDLTAADWAAMRARCEAATPGPWHVHQPRKTRFIRSEDFRYVMEGNQFGVNLDEDAEFIAHARTDLPLALDTLARQQEAIAELAAKLEASRALFSTVIQTAKKLEAALADRDATIARLREAQAWQPIETAPKDGVYIGANIPTSGYIPYGRVASVHLCTGDWSQKLTHWLPIPTPPALTPAKEAE